MKNFIGTFVISLVLCYILFFIYEVLIYRNGWAIILFVALIITIITTVFMHQEIKIEGLEERIKTLL